jgi:hypothetical protein
MDLAAGAEAILGDLGADALDFCLAHGDVDGLDARDCQERAQAMHEHGDAGDGEKLLGSGVAARATARGHPRSNPGCWKNHKDTHSQRSIQDGRVGGV